MKRRFAISILAAMVLVACISCATFDKNCYKSLDSARITYNQSMAALSQMNDEGKLSPAQVEQIIKIGNAYFASYQVAKAGYLVYHNNPTPTGEQGLSALITDVGLKLLELTKLVFLFQGGAK